MHQPIPGLVGDTAQAPALPLSTELPALLLGDKILHAADEGGCEERFCTYAFLLLGARTADLSLQGLTPSFTIPFFSRFVSSPCPCSSPAQPDPTPEAAQCSALPRSSVRGSGECRAAEQGCRELCYLQVEKQSLMRLHSFPPFSHQRDWRCPQPLAASCEHSQPPRSDLSLEASS